MTESKNLDASGIVLVDKPEGLTSHDVVAAVRRLIRPHRVGHTGTLDPLATGLLILCVGRATRIAKLLEAEYKVYRASLLLGVQTDTQDIQGTVMEQHPLGDISENRVREVAQSFVGWVEQIPPVFSAVKVGGVRSYRLARRQAPVSLKPRQVHIRRLEVKRLHLPSVEFLVECSTGTYVRTLCSDIGAALGVGGCLQALRRLQIGRFSAENAVQLSALKDERDVTHWLLSPREALAHLPSFTCDDEHVARLLHGNRVLVGEKAEALRQDSTSWVCALDSTGRLLAVGKTVLDGDVVFFQPKKLLVDCA